MKNSIHQCIFAKIEGTEPGALLFTSDFLTMGTEDAIHKTLSRLVRQKIISRLGKGIYIKPKYDAVVGPILPALDTIARHNSNPLNHNPLNFSITIPPPQNTALL